MSQLSSNEVSRLLTDDPTSNSSPEAEIPETCGSSCTTLPDQNVCDAEVIDLTSDDNSGPELASSSLPRPRILEPSSHISLAASSRTLARSLTSVRPMSSSTTSPLPVSSTVSGRGRCLWTKPPPPWATHYKSIWKQIKDAGLLEDRDVQEHPVQRSNSYGDAGPSSCEITPPTTDANSGSAIAGRLTLEPIPPPALETTDPFEIPETPFATEQPRCAINPAIVRVMGKRLDTSRAGYLVLCWVHPHEGEVMASDRHRCFREYDRKILRDTTRRERLSALRQRKQPRTPDSQGSCQAWKKARRDKRVSTSQSQIFPSRQVEEHLFVDSDVSSLDLELI